MIAFTVGPCCCSVLVVSCFSLDTRRVRSVVCVRRLCAWLTAASVVCVADPLRLLCAWLTAASVVCVADRCICCVCG